MTALTALIALIALIPLIASNRYRKPARHRLLNAANLSRRLVAFRCFRWLAAASLPALLALGGCANSMKEFPVQEQFGSATTFSRVFDATPGQTCEAARRALLSQGYLISVSSEELIQGRKSFQPELESHMAMEIRFVCAPNGGDGKSSLGFVTALQDLYNLKKSNNSATLGVGALGSVSLPFSSSNDAMVRVTSQTIASESFYDRFFELVRRYLVSDEASNKAR